MTLAGLRPVADADLDALVALNAASVPAVSAADDAHMRRLVSGASPAWVVERDGELTAFVLLFRPGADYESPNYRWFSERYPDFLYVDRVVVAASERGGGLGTALYDAVADEAVRVGAPVVAAEVNLDPPNPGSSRFHRRCGFEQVGTQRLGESYEVEMLVRRV